MLILPSIQLRFERPSNCKTMRAASLSLLWT